MIFFLERTWIIRLPCSVCLSLVALDTKRPRRRIASRKSSLQVTVDLVLAYLVNIRLTSGPLDPVIVLCHIRRLGAITLLLLK
jgi:hypothetical protein